MTFSSQFLASLALGTLFILAGCAQQPDTPEQDPAQTSQEASEPAEDPEQAEKESEPEPEPPTRPFTSETLYALLAAELAGSRQRFDIALSNYVQQAHQTRDPQVAARATHIARFMEADNAILDAALLWVDVDPDNTEAQLNAALALVQNGRLQEAFELSRKLQEKGEHTLFQNIAASAGEATDTQREQLLEGFQTLLENHPEHRELLIGTGLLLQQQGRYQEALHYSQRALEHHPDNVAAIILEAALLNQLDRSNEALKLIVQALEEQPESLRLRLQYARLLTQHDLALAQEQFEVLVQQEPNDPDLYLSLGIVALERGDREAAQESFETLLDSGHHTSTAHFYLGQLAENRDESEDALLHYLQVEPGSDFFQATLNILDIFLDRGDTAAANDHMNRLRSRFPDRAADLYLLEARSLQQKGYEDEALNTMNQALEAHPTHSDLRYSRAMLHDQRGNLEATERDLRALLKYDPNNATALNALGYILADRTDRYDEAYELISEALALEPEEPAILDSMGWVLYRMNEPEEALPYLEKAFEAYPDQEIAAHLGEVLWRLGEKERAREVWQRGLEEDPDSELIPKTLRRLEVNP